MTLLYHYDYIEIKASSCFHRFFFLKSHCLYNYFNIQYLIKVKLLFSSLVFTIISYFITDYNNLADEGVRCSYKGRIYYNDQINTLSLPGSILQNTRASADNENNTITERTGKVKIREVETTVLSFFLPKYEQIWFSGCLINFFSHCSFLKY